MRRVGDDDLQRVVQDLPDGLPVHAGGFHHRVCASVLLQPLRQAQQLARAHAERLDVPGHLAARLNSRASHQAVLGQVEPRASLMLNFHRILLQRGGRRGACGIRKLLIVLSSVAARHNILGCSQGSESNWGAGSLAPSHRRPLLPAPQNEYAPFRSPEGRRPAPVCILVGNRELWSRPLSSSASRRSRRAVHVDSVGVALQRCGGRRGACRIRRLVTVLRALVRRGNNLGCSRGSGSNYGAGSLAPSYRRPRVSHRRRGRVPRFGHPRVGATRRCSSYWETDPSAGAGRSRGGGALVIAA